MENKLRVYFGAPLFSNMETEWNARVVEKIRNEFGDAIDVYLPQANEAINNKSEFADSIMIASGDNKYLEESDVLIAVLDGPVIDAGLASEIGYFYSMNKPIIGVYTDSRQGTYGNQSKIDALDKVAENQFHYINLYTVGLIKMRGIIVKDIQSLIHELSYYI